MIHSALTGDNGEKTIEADTQIRNYKNAEQWLCYTYKLKNGMIKWWNYPITISFCNSSVSQRISCTTIAASDVFEATLGSCLLYISCLKANQAMRQHQSLYFILNIINIHVEQDTMAFQDYVRSQ